MVPYRADAAWSPLVYVSGSVALANRRVALLPRRFYVLAAARTSGGTDDAHALARVRVDCAPVGWKPDPHTIWKPPAPPPPVGVPAPDTGTSQAASMGAAIGVLLGLLLVGVAAYIIMRRRSQMRRVSARGELLLPHNGKSALSKGYTGRNGSWMAEGVGMGPLGNGHDEVGSASGLRSFNFDVFLSYRRLDGRIVDAVQDKLLLNSLRVFKDVNGHMAGRPFDVELFRVIRDSAVFVPVLTLEGMRRLASLTAESADFTLAEYITGARAASALRPAFSAHGQLIMRSPAALTATRKTAVQPYTSSRRATFRSSTRSPWAQSPPTRRARRSGTSCSTIPRSSSTVTSCRTRFPLRR